MIDAIWLTASYLAERARRRLATAMKSDPEAGALSLEWLVIAVALVAAAGVAFGIFKGAISAEAKKLP